MIKNKIICLVFIMCSFFANFAISMDEPPKSQFTVMQEVAENFITTTFASVVNALEASSCGAFVLPAVSRYSDALSQHLDGGNPAEIQIAREQIELEVETRKQEAIAEIRRGRFSAALEKKYKKLGAAVDLDYVYEIIIYHSRNYSKMNEQERAECRRVIQHLAWNVHDNSMRDIYLQDDQLIKLFYFYNYCLSEKIGDLDVRFYAGYRVHGAVPQIEFPPLYKIIEISTRLLESGTKLNKDSFTRYLKYFGAGIKLFKYYGVVRFEVITCNRTLNNLWKLVSDENKKKEYLRRFIDEHSPDVAELNALGLATPSELKTICAEIMRDNIEKREDFGAAINVYQKYLFDDKTVEIDTMAARAYFAFYTDFESKKYVLDSDLRNHFQEADFNMLSRIFAGHRSRIIEIISDQKYGKTDLEWILFFVCKSIEVNQKHKVEWTLKYLEYLYHAYKNNIDDDFVKTHLQAAMKSFVAHSITKTQVSMVWQKSDEKNEEFLKILDEMMVYYDLHHDDAYNVFNTFIRENYDPSWEAL